ncbi:phage tail protein [Aquimarina brevivitae]|uniref:Tail collar domain n=1 Tax=Aquimarina brevivitae TaxID=323412 RepID=A0A4Q7NYF4_9FLAO|nr:phage tail protein [Aquimarina brevivitae]RZS92453.1 tail collar domain [Aquimarina brevivitae]
MKHTLLISFLFTFFIISTGIAQSSANASGIAIQGIARNDNNTALINSAVNLTFQLYYLNASNLEETVYSETLSLTTDAFGVFSHVIDPGSVNNAIIANNQVYLRITEGSTVISNEKLKHVPYAISANNGVPTGSIMPFIGTTAPEGWVLCNGQSLTSVPGAANLIILLGSNNAPNLQGMFLRGTGTSPVNNEAGPSLMATQDDAFESHNHPNDLSIVNDGNHTHDSSFGTQRFDNDDNDGPGDGYVRPGNGTENIVVTSQDGSHSHNINGGVLATGNNETRPVNYGVNYIIKL